MTNSTLFLRAFVTSWLFFFCILLNIYSKVKDHPAIDHEGGVDVYLYTFFNLDARWDGLSTPRLCRFSPGKDPEPIVQEAGWAQGRFGRVRKISPRTGIRSPDSTVSMESLYRLGCPGPQILILQKDLLYADDQILVATSEADLQTMGYRLNSTARRKHKMTISSTKTNTMAMWGEPQTEGKNCDKRRYY